MHAEQRSRALIDAQLQAAGWLVQDRKQLNLFAGQGVAVRESIMAAGHGRGDYMLYVDQRAVDPQPRARRVFGFPQPETLARAVRDADANPDAPTWRGKVRRMPPLVTEGLRPAQIRAVNGIERSLAEQRYSRSLVQMATGAGKTYTAVTSCYRLLRHAGFRRVLFLVDRNNLGDQTLREFQHYAAPDDGRRFTELYNVDKLTTRRV